MRVLLLPLLLISFSSFLFAQSSTVLMQRCLGDSSNTSLLCLTKTIDGGYISGGWVTANGGDVSGYKGGLRDGWIVKLNQSGGIDWQRCFGGSSRDIVYDIIQSGDGGYIVTGSTSSYDGDISSTHSAPGKVAEDAFIAKLSSAGQTEWVKCYGGNYIDEFKKIIVTADGGFLCAGSTQSGDGDVTGYHAAVYPAQAKDVWVVKTDASGILQWNRAYGAGYTDQATDIVPTADGNYIIGAAGLGYGAGDLGTGYGGADVWLIKITANGNIIWQKLYGGSQDEHGPTIIPATDGGFVMAFLTYSNDGMCSKNHSAGPGITDIGMIKIADDGSVVWSNCYGGGAYDWYGNLGYSDDKRGGLIGTVDGGYLLCGSTSSTDGQVTGLHGPKVLGSIGDNYTQVYEGNDDAWVVKINQAGNLQWQKVLGGTVYDYGQAVTVGADASQFVVLGNVGSNDGDVSGLKVDGPSGKTNGWIAKIKAGNTITGLVFKDINSNNIQDAGEPFVTNALVTSSNLSYTITTPTHAGQFINVTDTGQFVTTVNYSPYYTSVPASITTPNHLTYYNSDTIFFALQPVAGKRDLVVNAFTPSFIRSGFDAEYRVIITNVGTVNIPSGAVKFVKDHGFDYKSSTPNVSSVIVDTLTWNYTNLNAGDTLFLSVTLRVQPPPAVQMNDTLTNAVEVTPVSNDVTPDNNTVVVRNRVTGSYDPNDKTEIHGGVITSAVASGGEYMQYTIRFQNVGNDTAFNVVVKDTLDSKLDWNSIQLISSSHPVNFSAINGNQLTWTFPNINLVDSITNEPLSHGYIVYQIRPKNNVVTGDIIHNDASIYFDYNLPVATNDFTTIVQDNFEVLATRLLSFSANRQNSKVNLLWRIGEVGTVSKFEIERSLDGVIFIPAGTKLPNGLSDYSFEDNVTSLSQKIIYYRLKVVKDDGSFFYSTILPIKLDQSAVGFSVYPNPANRHAFVSYQSEKDCIILLQIIDASGKLLYERKERANKGQTIIDLHEFSSLRPGNYLIRVQNNSSHSQWIIKLER
jgi:uncharacterized repeat protein (TIGR01451 family)